MGRILIDLLELTKPRVTFLVLFTATVGLWVAPQRPSLLVIFATLAGLSLAVGGVNALNMFLERDTDGLMERTRARPLPAGRLEPTISLWFGLALSLGGVAVMAALVNLLSGLLTLVAVMSYISLYTPLKQHSPWALHVGAIPGAMPPLIGWTAASGSLGAGGFALFGIIFLWQIPHFLAIALFRKEDYARAGIRVLPVIKSLRETKIQMIVSQVLLVPVSLLPVYLGIAGSMYLVAAIILNVMFLIVGLQGLRATQIESWARRVFLMSLIYLSVLYAVLLIP
ncbi:MAG: heme o synthase [Kiloniellales bacterium]|nr:heme o synthase [Kiloniellales bacterium]